MTRRYFPLQSSELMRELDELLGYILRYNLVVLVLEDQTSYSVTWHDTYLVISRHLCNHLIDSSDRSDFLRDVYSDRLDHIGIINFESRAKDR